MQRVKTFLGTEPIADFCAVVFTVILFRFRFRLAPARLRDGEA